MFLELVVLVAALANSAGKSAEQKRKCEEMRKRGAFRERDFQRRSILQQDFIREWIAHDYTHYPKEYVSYLMNNGEARGSFFNALISEQEYKEGLYPSCCIGDFNQLNYDPYANFKAR